MKKPYDHLVGSQFNYLTLLSIHPVNGRHIEGNFRCSCGNQKRLRVHSVIDGNTKSCGCLKSRRTRQIFTTHGMTGAPEYGSYSEMRKRCLNPKNHAYARYGGRGIIICDRWINSFERFFEDMGKRPTPHHSLDRIDNDGPYSPDNCRWATDRIQASNRRSTRLLTAQGRTLSHKEWAAALGVSRYMITSRVDQGLTGDQIVALFSGSAPQVRASI